MAAFLNNLTAFVHHGLANEYHWLLTALHFIAPAMLETAKIAVVATVLLGITLAIPRTRRVALAILAFVKRHAPKWAIPVLIAAAIFPGQADELVIIPIILLPILLNSRKRAIFARYISYSWKA